MPMNSSSPSPGSASAAPDTMTRILHTLGIIGRARLHGGLHVSDALPFGQQCEVAAALDDLAQFASLTDQGRPARTP